MLNDSPNEIIEQNLFENSKKQSFVSIINDNWASGITVALVSIPLSTALAIASGVTPMMGLISAIFGPAVGGLIGGSHYNILGPAGALVNINS